MPSKPKVFVTRNDYTEEQFKPLRAKFEVDAWDGDLPIPHDVLLKRVRGCDALIASLPVSPGHKIDQDVIEAAGPQLKAIVAPLAGYDHLDVEAIKKAGIRVGNAPGVFDRGVAEHTITLILMAMYRVQEHIRSQYDEKHAVNHWDKPLYPLAGTCLFGKTVGLVGFGGIAVQIAKRLTGFNLGRLFYLSRTEKPKLATACGATFADFDHLLAESDVIVIACTLNDSTRGMFGATEFKKMKKTAVLVNVARGEIIKQDDLEEALKANEIGYAALDVTTPEPFPWHHSLLKLDNCLVTPHMAVSPREVCCQGFNTGVKAVIAALEEGEMPAEL